jgi:hypothetical protein
MLFRHLPTGPFCLPIALLLWAGCLAGQAQLRTALEVRSLDFARAEAGQPVDLTGVAIFADPPGTIFI